MSSPKAFISSRTVLKDEISPAIVIVIQEKIVEIITGCIKSNLESVKIKYPNVKIWNFADKILMPGLVDSHVHINDPGRTDWEGFYTGTKAAAAGGVTTVVDMPLNSIPPTTSVNNLRVKTTAAIGNIFVDVAFWGGVIPTNINELKALVNAGVVGFKCFLCPSGVEEFPQVSTQDVEKALNELQSTSSVLAFHAEFQENVPLDGADRKLYQSFLKSRPPNMEVNAIKYVTSVCQKFRVACHIVHLSAAEALKIVSEAKDDGLPLTAETCHHYLTIAAEEIPESATKFKCCPPIRGKNNQDQLWGGIEHGILDMIVSDHSPSTLNLKTDDFIASWGGISSLQFGLPVVWTEAESRGFSIKDISRLMSTNPAKLCRLNHLKGEIGVDMDADFVVWDPDQEITVQMKDILYKNKISPYEGKKLKGKVLCTILRGEIIYEGGKFLNVSKGKLILNQQK